MARETIISAVLSLIILIFFVAIFASTPSPIQPYFLQLANSVLGLFVIAILAIAVFVIFYIFSRLFE